MAVNIFNTNSNTLLSGTRGNDTIRNGGYDGSTHKFYTGGSNVTIIGGAGNDTIYNNISQFSSISGGAGNDSIYGGGSYSNTISGGAGNDTIDNHGTYSSISGGMGNDSIYNAASDVTIIGGAGNDAISNISNEVTVSGGVGNDSIYNGGYSSSINGGAGNDSIYTGKNDFSSTIKSGTGDDYIFLEDSTKNCVIRYDSGDGNDTIVGFNSDDTLRITKGSYTTVKSGKDFIVKVGKQKITLKNALADKYNKITIKNSSGKVVTYNDWKTRSGSVDENYAKNVILSGSKKNDTIRNYADNVLITGQAGNDSIYNYHSTYNYNGNYSTISGGTGNDYIYNYNGDYVTISGGVGNDSIYNDWYASDVTITGGKGKDLVSLNSISYNNVIQYASGDGNDTILGFDSSDTLHITKGSYSAKASGNDFIVKVGRGKITLKDAVGKTISITDAKGETTTKTYGSSSSQTAELFAENNFVTADNLSEIIEEKSVGEVEFTKPEKFSQENLITYADK